MAEMGTLDILVRALGAKETEEELKGLSKEEKNTAKELQKQQKSMEKFSVKFAGMMALVTTSIVAATSALLLKAPIISEIGFALGVLVEELAFMMDTVLAPLLEPLVDGIFWLATKFDELSPPMKTAITVIILLVGALAGIGGAIAAVVVGILTMSPVIIGIMGVITALVGIITTVITLILGLALVIPILLGPIGLAIIAFILFKDEILSALTKAGEAIINFFVFIGSVIYGGVQKVIKFFEPLTTFLGEMWDGIKDKAIEVWTSIVTWIGDAIDLIKTTISQKKTAIESMWSNFWGGLKDTVTGAFDWMKNVFSGLYGVIKSILNQAIDLANKAIDSLNSISVSIPDWVEKATGVGGTWSLGLPNIPKLEVGGKVTGTGTATVDKGETVLTRELTAMLEQFFAGGGFGGGGDVYLDSHKVGQVLNKSNSFQTSAGGF